jgi:DNA polymerase-1
VCASIAYNHPVGGDVGDIFTGADNACSVLRNLLQDGSTLAVANGAYDFGVACAHDPTLLPLVFKAYDENRVFDVLIATQLAAIAEGTLGQDPRTGGKLKDPATGKQSDRYSLAIVCDLILDRRDAKKNDFWRKRYAILEKVPFERWPEDAKQYPLDDARNTVDCAVALIEGAHSGKFRNLHNLPEQCRAAWALHLACIWGLRTEKEAVEAFAARSEEKFKAAQEKFKAFGLIDAEGKANGKEVKRRAAIAYGASGVCSVCGGSGSVTSPKSGADVICKASAGGCDGTGLDIASAQGLPRTDSGGVAADRDTLKESGDDVLEEYGDVSETRKLLETYLPYLRQGTERPINPISNVLVASGRTSYDGLVQLMPRGGGVRDTFVPRPGYYFCSIDYNALELATLAQCQLWICGQSTLAEVLNGGLDPHSHFASAMIGMPYDEFVKQMKAGDKKLKNYRQAAKPPNFGFPGGMGAATLVLQQRRVGEKNGGVRFCKALEGAEVCGIEKVTEWKRKQIPPTCKRCIELAEELRSHWFRQWPEMKEYFAFVNANVNSYGEETQFVSERVRGGLDFCNGANTFFQGLAADGAKFAFYNVSRECYLDRSSPMYGSRPVIFVHDEIFSEIPIAIAHEAATRMTEVMISSMKKYVPDVKIGAAPALCKRWLKDAEAKYVDGRLVPWEPEPKKEG